MLQQDLCDYRDAYIVVKGTNTVTDPNDAAYDKNQFLKIMYHSLAAFHKSIIHLLIMLNTQRL